MDTHALAIHYNHPVRTWRRYQRACFNVEKRFSAGIPHGDVIGMIMAGKHDLQSGISQLFNIYLTVVCNITGIHCILTHEMFNYTMVHHAKNGDIICPGLIQFLQYPAHGFIPDHA